jgi:hypothetical protein
LSWATIDPGISSSAKKRPFSARPGPAQPRSFLITVTCDGDGMKVELLPALLEEAKQRTKVKFIYTIPDFHNPWAAHELQRRRPARPDRPGMGDSDPRGRPLRLYRFDGDHLPSFSPWSTAALLFTRALSRKSWHPEPGRWAVVTGKSSEDGVFSRRWTSARQGCQARSTSTAKWDFWSLPAKIVDHYRKKRTISRPR